MSISLLDYLKRKRTNLKDFIKEQNISSYEQILEYCKRRGCVAPEKNELDKFFKKPVVKKRVRKNKNKANKNISLSE